MHPDILLLAERLVVAIERMSQDVNNISSYVYDLSYTVSHFINEKRGCEGISPIPHGEDDSPSVAEQGTSAGTECSWQYDEKVGNSLKDSLEPEEVSLGRVTSMRVGGEASGDISSTILERIKTEEHSESEENHESYSECNISGNGRNNERISPRHTPPTVDKVNIRYSFSSVREKGFPKEVKYETDINVPEESDVYVFSSARQPEGSSKVINQLPCMESSAAFSTSASMTSIEMDTGRHVSRNLFSSEGAVDLRAQCVESFPIASCSTTDVTMDQEGTAVRYLPMGHREEQMAGVIPNQYIGQSEEGGSCVGNEGDSTIMPFVCSVCQKVFSSKILFALHMQIHTRRKPLKSVECGKAFQQMQTLPEQTLTPDNDRLFRCNLCSKSYVKGNSFNKHMRTHNAGNRFQCIQCKKTFRRSDALTVHMLIHTGQKPYKCMSCRKSFRQKAHLTKHLKVHRG